MLITTRLIECQGLGVSANLDDLGQKDSIRLLVDACGIEPITKAKANDAEVVVSMLGQHALALVHAGAYIKKGYCSLAQYPRHFQDQAEHLMKFKPMQQASRYGSVYTTFEVTANSLACSEDEAGHLALAMLEIFAFLGHEDISEDMFARAFIFCQQFEDHCGLVWNGEEYQDSEQYSSIPFGDYVTARGHYQECVATIDDEDCGELHHLSVWHCKQVRSTGLLGSSTLTNLRSACVRLSELSLIEIQNEVMSIHPLIHEWTLARLDHRARRCAWEKTLCLLALSTNRTRVWMPFSASLQPHIQACIQKQPKATTAELSLDIARGLYCLGFELLPNGSYKIAFTVFEALAKSCCVRLHTWTSKNEILLYLRGTCLRLLGRHEESRAILHQVLDSRALVCDVGNKSLIQPKLGLCYLYNKTGQMQKTVAMLEPSWEQIWKSSSDDITRSCILHALSQAKLWLGEYVAAIDLLEQAVEINARVLLTDAPIRRSCVDMLAKAYTQAHHYDHAQSMLEGSSIQIQATRPDDPYYLRRVSDAAAVYIKLGKNDQAIKLLESVVDQRRTCDPNKGELVNDTRRLAKAYYKIGQVHRAKTLLEEVLSISSNSNVVGLDQLSAMELLARTYLKVGEVDRAAGLFEEVLLESQEYTFSEYDRLYTKELLARAYIKAHKKDKSNKILQEVISELQTRLSNGFNRFLTMERLAAAYIQLRADEQGIMLLEQIVLETRTCPTAEIDRLRSISYVD